MPAVTQHLLKYCDNFSKWKLVLPSGDAPLGGSKDRHIPRALQIGLWTPLIHLNRFILLISHRWPVDGFGRAYSSFPKSALSLSSCCICPWKLPGLCQPNASSLCFQWGLTYCQNIFLFTWKSLLQGLWDPNALLKVLFELLVIKYLWSRIIFEASQKTISRWWSI